MISQTAEYALRAMVCLSAHWREGLPTSRIVDRTQVPSGYLPKVMRLLDRAGLIYGIRGAGGGYYLKRLPSDITLWDVVKAVEPGIGVGCCPTDTGGTCALHATLNEALDAMRGVLESTTLADLLNGVKGVPPLGVMVEL